MKCKSKKTGLFYASVCMSAPQYLQRKGRSLCKLDQRYEIVLSRVRFRLSMNDFYARETT